MTTTPDTAAGIVAMLDEALGADGRISARRMFGEYGLYADGVFFALICDETLFLKPVPEVRAAMRAPAEGIPYPGAKPWLRPGAEDLDDPDQIARLVGIALQHLPPPKPRKRR